MGMVPLLGFGFGGWTGLGVWGAGVRGSGSGVQGLG